MKKKAKHELKGLSFITKITSKLPMIFHGNTRKPPMQKFKMPKIPFTLFANAKLFQ